MVMKNLSDQNKILVLSKLSNIRHKSFFRFLLLVSGDVSLNPGPPDTPVPFVTKEFVKVFFVLIVKCGYTKNVRT